MLVIKSVNPGVNRSINNMIAEEFELSLCSLSKSGLLGKLQQSRLPHFLRTVTNTLIHRSFNVRIPPKFVQDHGDKFGEDVALFEPAASRQLMWPTKLNLKRDSIHHYSVFVAGSGWKEFIKDHQVGEGDQVVFVLVGLSEFVVFIFNPDGLRKFTRHNSSINTCKFSSITKPPVQPASSEIVPRNSPRTNPTKRMRLMSDPVSNSKVDPAALQIPSSSGQYDLKSNLKSNDTHVTSVEVTRSSEDEATKMNTIEEKVMQFNSTLERKRPSDPGADSSSAASSCPNQFLKTMVETNFRGSFGNPKSARLFLPAHFTKSNRLKIKEYVKITGPSGTEHVVKCVVYLSERYCLTNGWPEFVVENELSVGDILRFTLCSPSRFLVRLL